MRLQVGAQLVARHTPSRSVAEGGGGPQGALTAAQVEKILASEPISQVTHNGCQCLEE